MVESIEGGFTRHQPDGTEMTVYDAAMKYQEEGVPLIVMAGINYGSGSSRDWAAKGTKLLGVRAVVARSFERIHRSNLPGMGVLPLQFKEGVTFDSLGINGTESFHIRNLEENLKPSGEVVLEWENADGGAGSAVLDIRLDTPIEVEIYRNGGILDMVLRKLIAEA